MSATLLPAQVLARYPAHDDTIPSLLRSRVAERSGHEALRFEARSWRYGEIERASNAVAAIVAATGIVKGDRVALLAPNSDLALIVFLGIVKAGGVFAPMNPALTDAELAYILEHSGARLVVADHAQSERALALAEPRPARPGVIDLNELGAAEQDSVAVLHALATRLRLQPPAVDLAPRDPAIVIYTSGTTGLPKGVLHSHRNYVWAGEAFVERMYLQPDDRLLTMLPIYHINALFYSWGGAVAAGATLITAPGFSASRLWDLAAETGATEFNTLAAVGNILAKRPRTEFRPEHRITKLYGGPISADMMQTFQNDFHVPDLIEGYGMSEIPGACNNPFDGVRKIGSIGKPARHPRLGGTFVEMKIVDDDGRELPAGEKGEILVKTPIVMLGYLNDPAQTQAAFADGWFRTGDIAWRDDDGYYYFVTRKKDIIRRRGENISGAEVDRVLTSHPDVLEAAAIGVPSELGEEEILAVLVARPGTRPTPETIVAWCQQHLAAMKVPRYVVFVDQVPHSASQRVAKFRLKEEGAALLARAFDREKPR